MDEFFGSVYTSAKNTKMLFISAVVGAVVNVILCLVLVPLTGLDGAAVAALGSYLLIYCVRDVHTEKFFPFRRYRRAQAICTTLLLISALAMTRLDSAGLYVSSAVLVILIFVNWGTFKSVAQVIVRGRISHITGR